MMKATLSYRRDDKDTEPVGVSCFHIHEEKSKENEDAVASASALEVFTSIFHENHCDPETKIEPIVGSKTGKEVCVAMYGHPEICADKWSRVVWTVVGNDIHALWFSFTKAGKRHKKSGVVYTMIQSK
jgi:hypothetical protein